MNFKFSKKILKLNTNFLFRSFARLNPSRSSKISENIQKNTSNIDLSNNYSEEFELSQSKIINNNTLYNQTEEQINDNQRESYSNENTNTKKSQSSKVEDKFETEKAKETVDYIYGRQACEAVLKSKLRKIIEVNISVSYRVSPPENIKYLIELANSRKIKPKFVTKAKLDKVSLGKNHNGIALKCSRKNYIDCKKFIDLKERYITKEKGNVVVVIDRVSDIHSAATLIRSCVYLGTEAIVFNKEDRPMISSKMAKFSGGASEVVDILSIKFIKKFLQEAQKEGWKVISANSDSEKQDDDSNSKNNSSNQSSNNNEKIIEEEAINLSFNEKSKCQKVNLQNLPIDIEKNNVIILISSDAESHANSCNFHVTLPPLFKEGNENKFPYNIIDTLNSGVTLGMILSQLRFNSKLNQSENI